MNNVDTQAKNSCAFQGVPGAFSHIAAERFLSTLGIDASQVEFLYARQFRDIFAAVDEGRFQYGVVPIENSLAGSIYENLDQLMRFSVWVAGELYLRVEHQLLVLPEVKSVSDIQRVYSHPQALSQCRQFFESNQHLEELVHSDTARAAAFVAGANNIRWAAIASKQAATRYGLKVLQANLEDDPLNYTRFLLIRKNQGELLDEERKLSTVLTLAHKPGSLAGLLSKLAQKNCNLSKIESRPIHGKPFEYRFYLDVELPAGFSLSDFSQAAKEFTQELRILGAYKKAEVPSNTNS